MQTLTVTDPDELHLYLSVLPNAEDTGCWFRGQSNHSWPLVPAAGRAEYFLAQNGDLDRFQNWLREAASYVNLPTNRYESLALAQHYGLATRLLDWSANPLVAAYFACQAPFDEDGSVYAIEAPAQMIDVSTPLDELSNTKGILGYLAPKGNPRILNQKGMFTVHCGANWEIEKKSPDFNTKRPNIREILIKKDTKQAILTMLDRYGISEATIFPGLEGISASINLRTNQLARKI